MSKIKDFFTRNSSRVTNAKISHDHILWKVNQLGEKTDIKQGKGFIFEYLENAKYNEMRGGRGLSYCNIITGLPKERGGYGETHAIDDLRMNGNSYQCKVHTKIDDYFVDIFDSRYKDLNFVVPNDQYAQIQEELSLKYQNGVISKRDYLDYSNRIFRGHTSTSELYKYCDENGRMSLEAAKMEAVKSINNAFLKDCLETTKISTLSYMITGSVVSTVKNVNKYLNNKNMSTSDCFKAICKDTVKCAGKGFTIGTLSNVFSYIGHSMNSGNILTNGAVSLTLANGIFDLGATYHEYISGNIDSANFYEQIIAKSIISTVSLIARISIVSNPILSTITACVLSSITSEILNGSRACICDGGALLFDQIMLEKVKEENTKMMNRLSFLSNKQSRAYESVKKLLIEIDVSKNEVSVLESLKSIALLLNLNITFENFAEFQKIMRQKQTILI